MVVKLLVTDIDETLSRGEGVTPPVERACSRLRDQGWSLMVATGRVLASSLSHIKGIGSTLPAIVYNGGRVMDPVTRGALSETTMDPALVREVVEAAWHYNVELQVMGDEKAYCRPRDKRTRHFFGLAGIPVDDSMREPFSPEKAYRVIFHGEGDAVGTLQKELRERFSDRVQFVLAGERFLDALPPGVSKGRALTEWLQSLPAPPDLVVAAGDHHNDLELLQTAQIAAAPEDAAEEVLNIAQVIMPSADNHGFAALVDWLLEWEKDRPELPSAVVLS